MQSLKQSGVKTGLWVPCEGDNRFLDSKAGIQTLLKLIDSNSISDVFLQIFRSGRTWFKSKIFEHGADNSELPELLKALEQRKVSVHAWINVCNSGVTPSQKFIEFIGGKAALLQDNKGRDSRSNFDNFEIDTAGLWLEPSNPALISSMTALVSELAQFSFSGLHLDFIRYPYCIPIKPASWIDCGFDFGYSQVALDRFQKTQNSKNIFKESKKFGTIPSSENFGQAFDAWRRIQIDNLVECFRQSKPKDWKLSVAALAWSDRAYLNAYQDWRNWQANKMIDFLCLMTYTADTKLLTQQIKQATAFSDKNHNLFAGIGLYKLSSKNELDAQIKAIRDLNTNPCYFCANRLLRFPS